MKVLVVVDMQNDFIDGVLGTKEAQDIVNGVVDHIKEFDGDRIIYTKDTHYKETYNESQEGRKLPVMHCIVGTEGYKLNDKVAEVIEKRMKDGMHVHEIRKGAFGSKALTEVVLDMYEQAVNRKETLEVDMIGLCTDICVVSNALLIKSMVYEAEVVVYEKLCAGTTVDNHKAAIQVMKCCQVTIK